MAEWLDGARGALCLSFDNLGEAAAIELGALAGDDPSIGAHPTVTQTLPSLLELLGERGLAATFFVEGLNAELYPEALKEIAARHEVAYHAWRHEQWGDLSAEQQIENLNRGLVAFRELGGSPDDGPGIELRGLRPPGGQLGASGLDILRETGLHYASPAGEGAGIEGGIALLPFQWRHVDATCVLPPLAPMREGMTGSAAPVDPDAFLAYLSGEIECLEREGGFMAIVLHLSLLEWLGDECLTALLDQLAEASGSGDLWLTTCAAVAEHMLAYADKFEGRTTLDSTSWTA